MSYTPTTWATGDVITAEKLNKLENGVADGAKLFVINATNVATSSNPTTTPTLDKTFDQIKSAYDAGMTPVIVCTEMSPFGDSATLINLAAVITSQSEAMFMFLHNGFALMDNYAICEQRRVDVGKTRNSSSYYSKNIAYYTS